MKILLSWSVRFALLVAFIFACLYMFGAPNAHAAITLSDKVVITMANGTTHTFLKSSAIDKGSFTSPAGFTQKNLCATSTLPDMTVCFRPDVGDNRDEVVFEYGTFMKTPTNTGAYTVMIYAGNTALISSPISISNQYFYQRWRWVPQGFRPRYRTVTQLEAAKLIPPYRTGVNPDPTKDIVGSPDPRLLTYTPMPPTLDKGVWDNVMGVFQAMGGTGERDDLGPVTGPQGKYLISQREDWWTVVLHQAEVSGSIPWNIRDEGGTPMNFFRSGTGIVDRKLLTWHSNSWGANYNLDNHTNNNTGWGIDSSHQPALNYLPWLLTGDPYYLEGLQFQSASNVMYTNWGRNSSNLHAVMSDQLRGNAWNLRNLLGLALSTPDSVPGWLNPRSDYQRASRENAQEVVSGYVNGSGALQTVMRAWMHGLWQQDFFNTISGWATWSGLTEWSPIFNFGIQNSIGRVNGTSGWPRHCPINYYFAETYPSTMDKNQAPFTNWSEAWYFHKTFPGSSATNVPMTGLCSADAYASYLLGALSIATHLGVGGAESYHKWLTDQIKINISSDIGHGSEPKWDIAPTYLLNGSTPTLPNVSDALWSGGPSTPTATLTASVAEISAGQSVTLTWSSSNVSSCAGNGFTASGTSGTVTITPSISKGYAISCTGTNGPVSAFVAVKVTSGGSGSTTPPPSTSPSTPPPPPPPLVCVSGTSGDDLISADQTINCIDGGTGKDTAKITYPSGMPLSWVTQTTNSDGSVTIVDIHATGYSLTLKNVEVVIFPTGEMITISSNVTTPTTPPPPPPTPSTAPTVTLTASKTSITTGGTSNLTWGSTNATSCTGTGFTAAEISGAVTVSPTVTTTYSISCTGAGGSASANVTVTVSSGSTGSGTISVGSRVKATANLNVRSNAGTRYSKLCVQRRGALGTVTAGPKTGNGYTWWQVNFDSRCDGWVVRNYLTTSLAMVTDEDTEIAHVDTTDREAQLAAAMTALESLLKQIQELMNR